MKKTVDVRLARTEDKDAVIAFCQNTFSWGDYISEVYDKWVRDLEGKLLVATIDQQPVGIAHVAFLGNAVAWMEGMRVHRDFRRQGIGGELDCVGRQVARENGCQVARLVTSMKNLPAQKSLDTEGYHRAAQFNEWETEPAPEDFSEVRVASENDLPQMLAQWYESETSRASHMVIPNRYWHWKPIDERRLRGKISANEVRMAENGFAIVTSSDEKDWTGMIIYALAGDEPALVKLARAVRGEAAYRGYPRVEATVADYAPLNNALERAGYRTDSGLYLYEQPL